jgi:hypothetical protein
MIGTAQRLALIGLTDQSSRQTIAIAFTSERGGASTQASVSFVAGLSLGTIGRVFAGWAKIGTTQSLALTAFADKPRLHTIAIAFTAYFFAHPLNKRLWLALWEHLIPPVFFWHLRDALNRPFFNRFGCRFGCGFFFSAIWRAWRCSTMHHRHQKKTCRHRHRGIASKPSLPSRIHLHSVGLLKM